MEICSYQECTGCAACQNACAKNCISMVEDAWGELHPMIDESKCVGCGMCQRVCPNNTHPKFLQPQHCYASWITNKDKRKICASGGLATIMSEYVIRNKQGVVFGTAYDKEMHAVTTYTETVEGLERFKGSKYVQSRVSADTFRTLKKFLKEGRFVLYVATPCQIAGLKGFLRKEYENLVTVDLICHGVCPQDYLDSELSYLCDKHNIRKEDIVNVRFRGNDDNNYHLTLWDRFKKRKANNFAFTIWKNLRGGGK